MTELVSVLLPTYNSGDFLSAALQSICEQTYDDLEILVLDDGSTDGSVDALSINDPRIKIIRKTNTGLADTLNWGIEASSGRLLARMDADDFAHPDRIARQVAAFEQSPSLVLLGTQMRRVAGDGSVLATTAFPRAHSAIVRGLLRGEHVMSHPTIMMRKDAVDTIGGYWSHGLAEDWDLFLRLSEVGDVENLAEVGLDYRFHNSSINSRSMRVVRRNILLAVKNAGRRRSHQAELTPEVFEKTIGPLHRNRLSRETASLSLYRQSLQLTGWRSYTRLLLASLIWPEQAVRRVLARLRPRK